MPNFHWYELPEELARQAGVSAIGAGYEDTAGATGFDCYEGDQAIVKFQSCGMSHSDGDEEEDEDEVEFEVEDGDDMEQGFEETRFSSSRLPQDWIDKFEDEGQVQDALAKEFDAFIPVLGATGFRGSVEIFGYDDRDFKPSDYLRIDLIGFGDAKLETTAADHQLLEAITSGDVEALRAAVAAGADLRRLPGQSASPLNLALGTMSGGEARRDLVAALLELGAEVNQAGQEPPVHAVLNCLVADEGELIPLLELLIDHGADVNARGFELLSRIQSPLHVAAMNGWLAVTRFLVFRGADLHATDSQGHTPRQTAKAAAEPEEGFVDDDAKYGEVAEFLADAEAGRAQLDWHKDAEQSSRRERRRKREMKVAFDELGAALKALGKLSSDDPSPEALAEGIIIAQPEQIHLTPSEDDWPSEPARARAAALLAAEGFQPIGRFAIREMPGLRLEAYYHPGEHLDAVIYDAAGQSGVDLVRFAADGTMLTVTSNVTRPEAHFEMPGRRMIRLPGAPLADLLRTLRADPEPPSGLAPAPPDEFVKRFEAAHRREARALKQQVRRKARKK